MLAGMPAKVFETLKQVKIGGRRLNISRLADGSGADDWPAAVGPKADADAPALPPTAEPEDRPIAKKSERPAPVQRPAGKKFKAKLKPKFAAPKAKDKGNRTGRKRLLPTR